MTMDEKELLRQLSERYPPQEESGQQLPDWMMQGGQPAQMPMGMQLLPARPEGAMPGTGFPMLKDDPLDMDVRKSPTRVMRI